MTQPSETRGEATRRKILETSLELFREKGFDGTTMRDIAKAAGVSLGAAYYYFTSKEAIAYAYYETQLSEFETSVRADFSETEVLAERLRIALGARFGPPHADQKLMSALFRAVGDVTSPVSVFAEETRTIRNRSIRLYIEALSVPEVPEDLRKLGGLALFALQLGLLLYFVHDRSPDQHKTRDLVDNVVGMLVPLVPFLAGPLAAPVRDQLRQTLESAGLVPEDF